MNANAWIELVLVIATVLIGMCAGTWAIIRALSSLFRRLFDAEVKAPVQAMQAAVEATQANLERIANEQNTHTTRITRMETIMEVNGCLDPDGSPICGRRK